MDSKTIDLAIAVLNLITAVVTASNATKIVKKKKSSHKKNSK